MRLKTFQIAAALGAAIAFVLAFMAAGIMLLSLLFAGIGAILIAWVAYGVARSLLNRQLSQDHHEALPPPAG